VRRGALGDTRTRGRSSSSSPISQTRELRGLRHDVRVNGAHARSDRNKFPDAMRSCVTAESARVDSMVLPFPLFLLRSDPARLDRLFRRAKARPFLLLGETRSR